MSPTPPLTVVVSVLNEERSLAELHRRLRAALPAGSELVFVDDGSTDGTAEVLSSLAAADEGTIVITFARNVGKSVALAAGLSRASGELVATIDADLQESPEDIPRLVEKLNDGYDLVGGWRHRRRDPFLKVFGSRCFNRVARWLGGVRVRDMNCGLKVFRREVLDALHLTVGFHRFVPLLAHWRGFRTTEVAIEHRPREHGVSRYGKERIFQGLIDLVVVVFLLRNEARPGRFFVGTGTAMGLAGFAISLYLAILRLATGSIQSRFPLLALGLVLIVFGFQLVSLGFFGELIAYHFRSSRGRADVPAPEVTSFSRSREAR